MNNTAIKELFDTLYLCERQLTAGQSEFVAGCKRYYQKNKELSEKQLAALLEIRKYLKVDEQIRVTNNIKN